MASIKIKASFAAPSTGTVTSVAALTLGTTGTDLTSTVVNPNTTPVITLNVPNASATARGVVTTGTQTFAGSKTIQSAGSQDTLAVNHTSGTGHGIHITKAGNNEALYVNKTGGTGNAVTIVGTLNATTLVKSGGTSSQFLKADGTVDSTAYAEKLITTNRQTASYTLVLSDADKLVEMNVGSANNLTVPLNSTVPYSIGTQILISQYGAGQTTVVATGGVTIRSSGGKLKLNAQYSGATLIKIATDEWYLFGDIAA